MPQVEALQYTVGVFRDIGSATKAIEALTRHGFPKDALTVAGLVSDDLTALASSACGRDAERFEDPSLGALVGAGPLAAALGAVQPAASTVGLAVLLRQFGFQAHDGRIFEALVGRGGVLVAVRSESRAGDALATLHNYGGGNAAIGAWVGRL